MSPSTNLGCITVARSLLYSSSSPPWTRTSGASRGGFRSSRFSQPRGLTPASPTPRPMQVEHDVRPGGVAEVAAAAAQGTARPRSPVHGDRRLAAVSARDQRGRLLVWQSGRERQVHAVQHGVPRRDRVIGQRTNGRRRGDRQAGECPRAGRDAPVRRRQGGHVQPVVRANDEFQIRRGGDGRAARRAPRPVEGTGAALQEAGCESRNTKAFQVVGAVQLWVPRLPIPIVRRRVVGRWPRRLGDAGKPLARAQQVYSARAGAVHR